MRHHRLVPAFAVCLVVACANDGSGNSSAGLVTSITGAPGAGESATGDGGGSTEGTEGTDSDGSGGSGSSGSTSAPTTAPGTPVTTADTDTASGPGTGGMPGDDPNDPTTGALPDTSSTGGSSSGGADLDPPPPGTATDKDLLVALVGDQGSGSDTKAVYQLILDEGADMLIILGDFDYGDDPDGWAVDMESVLGDSFPVFGVVGNHDVAEWPGYQTKLQARLDKIPGAVCTGDLGVMSRCNYRGLHFILSGLGTLGNDAEHEKFIADTLADDDSLWSLCAWHKNMRDLQAGDKKDEITWKGVQNCQDAGAIVVMGHEHSYARTMTLTAVGDKAKGHGATGVPELMELEAGKTFSVVSGLGGKSIRAYEPSLHDDDTWWATLYTSNYHRKNGVKVDKVNADYGVLFMRFNVEGDPAAAHGYFKNVQGELVDEFDAVRR